MQINLFSLISFRGVTLICVNFRFSVLEYEFMHLYSHAFWVEVVIGSGHLKKQHHSSSNHDASWDEQKHSTEM
jgi:hypothetical protein